MVAGLDLSLTRTGIALLGFRDEPSDNPLVSCLTTTCGFRSRAHTHPIEKTPDIERLASLICEAVVQADVVLLEGPAYKAISTSTWDRGGLFHIVASRLYRKGILVGEVAPLVAKKVLTGTPGASKELMQAKASADISERLGRREHLATHDEADAYALALTGAYALKLLTGKHPAVMWTGTPYVRTSI